MRETYGRRPTICAWPGCRRLLERRARLCDEHREAARRWNEQHRDVRPMRVADLKPQPSSLERVIKSLKERIWS